MNALTCSWISGSFTFSKCSSKFQFYPSTSSSSSSSSLNAYCKYEVSTSSDLKFELHDALDSSGLDTTHARAARNGFCSQIEKLSSIERETSISINRRVDLGRAALYIAAEDDSLVSHSSVPLPVEDFLDRLDDLSMSYCSHYASSLRFSPENFLECLERYLYIDKGFRRTSARNQVEQRALYLHSVLTHRSGSASLLSLIYAEILKLLRLWGLLDFDVEVFFPRDSHSSPRGYLKQKGRESDQSHIMTPQSLLVEILKDLKNAFWPFQRDPTRSPFLRAAWAANHSDGSNNIEESAWERASAKAAQHRLERGVWTSVHFGDMRRALSGDSAWACHWGVSSVVGPSCTLQLRNLDWPRQGTNWSKAQSCLFAILICMVVCLISPNFYDKIHNTTLPRPLLPMGIKKDQLLTDVLLYEANISSCVHKNM